LKPAWVRMEHPEWDVHQLLANSAVNRLRDLTSPIDQVCLTVIDRVEERHSSAVPVRSHVAADRIHPCVEQGPLGSMQIVELSRCRVLQQSRNGRFCFFGDRISPVWLSGARSCRWPGTRYLRDGFGFLRSDRLRIFSIDLRRYRFPRSTRFGMRNSRAADQRRCQSTDEKHAHTSRPHTHYPSLARCHDTIELNFLYALIRACASLWKNR